MVLQCTYLLGKRDNHSLEFVGEMIGQQNEFTEVKHYFYGSK